MKQGWDTVPFLLLPQYWDGFREKALPSGFESKGYEHDSTQSPDLFNVDVANREIKEWQAIMDYLVGLPDKTPDGISKLTKDSRTREVRAIKV